VRKINKTQKQRGGSSNFKYSSNVGEIFTKIPNNTNPFLPDPINSNSNSRPQGGGGTGDQMGMSEPVLGWYKGLNAINNIPIRYNGGKPLMPADPMHQPGLTTPAFRKTTPNIPQYYAVASNSAAASNYTIS